jgi:serine/threonine protein kinase
VAPCEGASGPTGISTARCALKILPPDPVKNDERIRRFVQEAKSAASLNHPNIVTIYEIGEAEIGVGDGGGPERIHFIAMELVSGTR